MNLKMTMKGLALLAFSMITLMTSCKTDDVEAETIDPTKPRDAVFDFTSASTISGWGITIPGGSAGTVIDSITVDKVTIKAKKVSTNGPRIYSTGSGVLDLRVYSGDVLTFSVPEGYIITGMKWTSQNADTQDAWSPNHGTVSGAVWTAPTEGTVRSVKMTATGTTRMNVLTVTYVAGTATISDDPDPDPKPSDPEGPMTIKMDFTNADSIAGYGYSVPGKSAGIPLTGPITRAKFTFTPKHAAGAADATKIRLYTSSGGATDLRIYNGDTIVYSVPETYKITALSWTTANTDGIGKWTVTPGTISNGVWAAEEGKTTNQIQFVATGTTRISTLSVTYEPVKQ